MCTCAPFSDGVSMSLVVHFYQIFLTSVIGIRVVTDVPSKVRFGRLYNVNNIEAVLF